TAFTLLERCGVSVHVYHGQRYYIHAKLLVIDGQRALVSSQNLSTGSLQYNRELGMEVSAPAGVRTLSEGLAADFAGAGAWAARAGERRRRGWGEAASAGRGL